MKHKPAIWEKCETCGHLIKELKPEVRLCDECDKEIPKDEYFPVMATEDNNIDGIIEFEFCSWQCLFKKLFEVRNKYNHISLPHLRKDDEKFWDNVKSHVSNKNK